MDDQQQILARAAARGQQQGVSYAGAVTPHEAAQLLASLPNAVLVDVRTAAEWQWVGVVPGAKLIEWRSWPGMQPNTAFLEQLSEQVERDAVLLFLCRSGARSHDAAVLAQQAGFAHCYNVLEGFEGDKDAASQRGQLNGWRHAGLPWVQG